MSPNQRFVCLVAVTLLAACGPTSTGSSGSHNASSSGSSGSSSHLAGSSTGSSGVHVTTGSSTGGSTTGSTGTHVSGTTSSGSTTGTTTSGSTTSGTTTTGTTTSSSSTTGTSGTSGTDPCGSCEQNADTGACSTQYNACANDPNCVTMVNCINGCNGDATCQQSCTAQNATAAQELSDWLTCLCTPNACATACQCGTSGSTGSSGTTGTTSTTGSGQVATARQDPVGTAVNLSSVVTVMASSYGSTKADGGTQYAGQYYVLDPSDDSAIFVFKSKAAGPLAFDPPRGEAVNVTGTIAQYPGDAGSAGQVQVAAPNLNITDVAASTVPSPLSATATQLAKGGADVSRVGHYVHVPGGSYSQDSAPAEFTHVSGTKTYIDGVALTDGSGNRILVDVFTFKYSSGNCVPTDGGMPDLSTGNFNGVLDREITSDGASNKVVFYGHCGQ